jgi:EpsI family protein
VKRRIIYAFAAALMFGAVAAAEYITPTQHLAEIGPKLKLATALPETFGNWAVDKSMNAAVVSAEQKAMLDKIYSQLLSRTYYNRVTGERIMVSIAYGADQRESMQLHYPEVCYPAQGFELRYNQPGEMTLDDGALPVRRLVAQLGSARIEPITYWILVGKTPTASRTGKRLTELQYGLHGFIPDGLLFRVSSIDRDQSSAFKSHERFIHELQVALPEQARERLFGQRHE